MRLEFSRKVRAAVFLRAEGCCEACGMRLKTGEGEYDHVLPAALGGEATQENAKLLCRVCHRTKTDDDIRRIRKSDRQRDRHSGAMPKSKRGFRAWRKFNGDIVWNKDAEPS
jgi:5-methylcytosine-specific restriction protein A